MSDQGGAVGLLLIWLAFMTVTGFYVIRIGLMLREQRIMERAYRLRLATLRGAAVRKTAGTTGT